MPNTTSHEAAFPLLQRALLPLAALGAGLSAYSAWEAHFVLAAGLFAGGVALPLYLFSAGPRQVDEGDARRRSGAAEDSAPVLHPAVLEDLEAAGYGGDFLHEIADGFARDGGTLLRDMDAALRAGNLALFKDLAHTLKGNAISVGAQRLAQTCQRAEALPSRGEILLVELRREFDAAQAAVEDYLRRLTALAG